jgi:hypothetical protein
MNLREATIHVFKQNNNVPMHPKDIEKQIVKLGIYQPPRAGKTLHASIGRLCYLHNAKYNLEKGTTYPVVFTTVSSYPLRFKLADGIEPLDANNAHNIPVINDVIDLDSEDLVIPELTAKSESEAIYQIVDESIGWKRLSVYRSDTGIEYVLDDCYMYSYVLNEHTGKTVKIGKTKNDPTERLNTLRTANRGLTFNHVFPSSLYDEDTLHDMFEDIRDDGEFFFYAPKLIAFLNAEKEKHTKVLSAYRKMLETKNAEKDMLGILRSHSIKSLESIVD